MTVTGLATVQFTDDPRKARVEERDEGQVEALQWLGTQLMWEQRLADLRNGAPENEDGSSRVNG